MSCIYGQRQMGTEDQGWVAHFLIRALEGEPITLYGDGHQVRDILDVSRRGRRLCRGVAADRPRSRAAPSTSAAARPTRSACASCSRISATLIGREVDVDYRATGAPATSATSSPTPRARRRGARPARRRSPGATGVAAPGALAGGRARGSSRAGRASAALRGARVSARRALLMTADAVGGVWHYALDLAAALAPRGVETMLARARPRADAPTSAREAAAIAGCDADRDRPAARLAGDGRGAGRSPPARAIAALARRERRRPRPAQQPALAAAARFAVPVVAVAHGCVGTWWQAARRRPPPDPTSPGSRRADRARACAPPTRSSRRAPATPPTRRSGTTACPPRRTSSTTAARRCRARPRRAARPRLHRRPPVGRGQEHRRCSTASPRGWPCPFDAAGAARRARTARRVALEHLHAARRSSTTTALAGAARARGRSSSRPRASSRSAWRCSKRRRPAARWSSRTSRPSASSGTAPRCSSPGDDADGLCRRDRARCSATPRCALHLGEAARAARRALHARRRWPRGMAALYAGLLGAARRAGGGMKIVYFTHSLASCWNHGNAHFLRGVLRELIARGHDVRALRAGGRLEPRQPARRHGEAGLDAFAPPIPSSPPTRFARRRRSRPRWSTAPTSSSSTSGTTPRWSPRSAALRARGGALHAAVPRHPPPRRQRPGRDARLRPRPATTACSPSARRCREVYRGWGWGGRVWTWHEAADTRLFHPPARGGRARRPGLDRQLGRRRAHRRARGRSCSRPAASAGAAARHLRRALPRRGAGDCSRATASRYHGWAPNAARAGDLRAPPRHRPRAAPLLRRRSCPASRPSACSRRWPAASRWSRRRGTTARACSAPARTISIARDGAEMTAPSARAARRSRPARRARRAAASRRSAPATPAPTASTSCSPSSPASAPTRHAEGTLHEDRLLRLQPALLLLERRRDLLPRHPARPRRARLRHHLLRARRLRPAAAPRHRSARLGARRSSIPADRGALRARAGRGGAAPTSSSRRAASACSTTSCSKASSRTRAPGRARASSGTSTPPRRSTRCAPTPTHPVLRALPELDMVLTYGGGPPVIDAYRGFGARDCVPVYNALDPDDAPPGRRPTRASPPTSPSSATACPTARRGSRSSSSRPPRALPERALPARRQRLGRQGDAGQRPPPRPCLHRRAQRLQLHAHGGAQRRARLDGAYRLLARDPRVRGGRRRRLPDHRRLGGDRAVPEPDRRCWSRATGRTSPSISPRSPRSAPARSAQAALARVLAEHTYALRGAQVDALFREHAARAAGGGMKLVVLGLSALLVLGQRPRHHLPRAAARRSPRAATTSCSSSATCPGTPSQRDLADPDFCRLAFYDDLDELAPLAPTRSPRPTR